MAADATGAVEAATHPAWASGHAEGALAGVRAAAAARFEALGWPTTRQEAWKYTSLKSVRESVLSFGAEDATDRVDDAIVSCAFDGAWARVVLVDGVVDIERSRIPDDGTAHGLSVIDDSVSPAALGGLAPFEDDAIVAFNTAYLQGGVRVVVPAGAGLPGPVHVLHVATGQGVRAARVVVSLGANARATVVESWRDLGGDAGTTTAVVEVDVGPGAALDHVVDALAGEGARLLRAVHARVDRDARWQSTHAWAGGALVRAEAHVTLAGPGAVVAHDALVVLGGRGHVDQHNVFTHAAPHGTSQMRSKAVVGGRARAVFDGTVVVREGAQKTDARQDSRNLLLSEGAEIDAKPRLEIYADDVACAHGATVGRLDEVARTYLRSRGIPDAMAQRMLIEAFVADRVETVADPALRAWLSEGVAARLGALLDTVEAIDGEVAS